MGAAGYYVFTRAVTGDAQVVVPNIVGMPIAEAYGLLAENKLEVGNPQERINPDVPKNHILAQRPRPGQVVRAGRKVHPTISVGPDLDTVPDLIGQSREAAEQQIARAGLFQLAPLVARLPNQAAPGVVIGQDPAPGSPMQRGKAIALLVSAGAAESSFVMRDLTGMPLEEAMDAIRQMGLDPKPVKLERSDAPFDVVVQQEPAPGTVVQRGEQVLFKVRTTASLPNAAREVQVTYTVPYSWTDQAVRIDIVAEGEEPWTVFPRPSDYVDGEPPRLSSGQKITFPLVFEDQVTVLVYLDGEKVRSYYYEGNADPVITSFDQSNEGEPLA